MPIALRVDFDAVAANSDSIRTAIERSRYRGEAADGLGGVMA